MFFTFSTGSLVKLANALMSGDSNIIGTMIEQSVEHAGRDLIRSMLPTDVVGGAMRRVEQALETKGVSEIERLRRRMLASVRPSSPVNRLTKLLQQSLNQEVSSRRRHGPIWRRTDWATSRQHWLEEGWMHDWRSQPRNRIGEWIPGRLPYPVAAIGKPSSSRRLRRLRKARKHWRSVGKTAARNAIKSSWSNS